MSRRPTGMGQATPRAREGSSGVAVGPCRLGDQAGDGRRRDMYMRGCRGFRWNVAEATRDASGREMSDRRAQSRTRLPRC